MKRTREEEQAITELLKWSEKKGREQAGGSFFHVLNERSHVRTIWARSFPEALSHMKEQEKLAEKYEFSRGKNRAIPGNKIFTKIIELS